MAKFPEPPPPAELAGVRPDWRVLTAGTLLWRLYFRAGPHPTLWNQLRHYGPTGARFDHHNDPPREQERAILYAAGHGPTCLAEVFQETRLVDRNARDPWLVGFELAKDVQLLDLCGNWPTRAGASMMIASGPRPRARRWSRAIYAAHASCEGLHYPSSMHANRPIVALYERAAGALPTRPCFHRALADPSLTTVVRNAAQDLGYALL